MQVFNRPSNARPQKPQYSPASKAYDNLTVLRLHESYKPDSHRLEQQLISMNLHVRLYGVFRSAARASELDLMIPDENPTVKSAIAHLVSRESFADLKHLLLDTETSDPRPNALIMVSGREVNTLNGLDTKLTSGDELALLPVAHGG